MSDDPRPKILCVDDEQNVLDGLSRTLRTLFVVETAIGGRSGLEVLSSKGPFVIVTSDLRMPLMDGIEFLSRARELAPDTVRVLLTGQGDLEAAVSAVNDGNIFRFLTKPCPTGLLVRSLMAGAEQYRLLTAEKVLLEQTLRGSIKTLTDILALSNPAAFGRAIRVQHIVSDVMAYFKIGETWPVEVAAMLSQIGYVTLPQGTQEKIYSGEPLTGPEKEMVERVPNVVEQLLANIPRLDSVREILRLYSRNFTDSKTPAGPVAQRNLPWGRAPSGSRLITTSLNPKTFPTTIASKSCAAGPDSTTRRSCRPSRTCAERARRSCTSCALTKSLAACSLAKM